MNTNKIKTEAEVLEVSSAQKFARLKVEQSGCGSCSKTQACLFKSLCHSKDFQAELPESLSVKVGDRVEIAVEESTFFYLLFVAYLLPLFGLLAGIGGAYVASSFFHTEGEKLAIMMAASGLLIGMLVAKMVAKRLSPENIEPKIVQIITGL